MTRTPTLLCLLLAAPAAAQPFERGLGRALADFRAERPALVRAAHKGGPLAQLDSGLAHLVEETRASVVRIVAPGAPGEPTGVGTGFFVDGVLLTNHHVIGKAKEVRLRYADGTPGRATVASVNERKDVAVLVADSPGPDLPLAPAGLRPGQLVLALGHPRGLPLSASLGIVSGTTPLVEGAFVRFLQTDAAINPGNSGGPLLTMDGAVAGMNTLIMSESGGHEGLGFAVPAATLARLVARYRKLGHIRPGWLGVHLASGAVVRAVADESPARGALKKGDRILGLDGEALSLDEAEATGDLLARMADKAPGETAALEIERGTRRMRVQVTLGEFPKETPAPPQEPDLPWGDR